MESLPGYDDWKTSHYTEAEVPPLVYDMLVRPLEAVTEVQADGDEEWYIGCIDEPLQDLSLRFNRLPRDNWEALEELEKRLKQTLAIIQALKTRK